MEIILVLALSGTLYKKQNKKIVKQLIQQKKHIEVEFPTANSLKLIFGSLPKGKIEAQVSPTVF